MQTFQITLDIEQLEEGPYLGTSPDLPGLIVQADSPGGTGGCLPGYPLAGLGDDLVGDGQQFLQVVDRADEPASPPAGRGVTLTTGCQLGGLGLRAADRLLGVVQQPLGITGRGFGQSGQLTGALEHRGGGLVAAHRGA